MSDTVAVIVATYGDRDVWAPLAQRAASSVGRQTRAADELWIVHGPSLHRARNAAAFASKAEWLIFLDADDELDPLYIEASLAGFGDVRRPRINDEPYLTDDELPDLAMTNFLVVGSMCRRRSFIRTGGFKSWPMLEDWDLWVRMILRGGAKLGQAPEACYRYSRDRLAQRNKPGLGSGESTATAIHGAIRHANGIQ